MLPDVRRRIINAKYVLERAKELHAKNDEMSSSVALLLTHDAIELLMLALLDFVNAKPNGKRTFMDFWPDMKAATGSEPPDRIPLESLNKLRVGLKHSGNPPHEQTLSDLLLRSQGFFENVLSTYCNIAYSEISLLDLLADKEVVELLRRAQKHANAGEATDALLNLRFAFERANEPDGGYLPLLAAPAPPNLAIELRRAGFDRYFESLHNFLNATAITANTTLLGVDRHMYLAFRLLGPHIQWSWAGTATAVFAGGYASLDAKEFLVWFDFVVDYAYKAQAAYLPLSDEVNSKRPKREYFLRTGSQQ